MYEYIKWIFDPDNINANAFTMISVILSGLVSWVISAIYFSIGNRNNLRASVLYPVKQLIEGVPATWDRYRKLREYTKDYSMKYLKRREFLVVEELLATYHQVCLYKYERVCAESLQSYFVHTLKMNGIDPTPIRVWNDDDGGIDVGMPDEMLYFSDDVERIIMQYPPEYDAERCYEEVSLVFELYCKKCYTDKNISFFDDSTFLEVLENAENKIEWDEKFQRYKKAKEAFFKIK